MTRIQHIRFDAMQPIRFPEKLVSGKTPHMLRSHGPTATVSGIRMASRSTELSASPPRRAARDGVPDPWNRKLIGSKFRLLPFLEEAIVARAGARVETLLEPFAGTGALACHLLRRGIAQRAILVDLLACNATILRGCLGPGRLQPGSRELHAIAAELDALPPRPGYATRVWGDRYFTARNAARIDAIRDEIERRREAGELGERAHALLVGALLLAADGVANTVGQYDAFLKHLGGPCYDERGRHLVDGKAKAALRLRLPRIEEERRVEVATGDAVALAPELPVADVAYLDPPYNQRQYCDNYHVLESIARWEKPPVRGVTAKFDRTGLRSDWSRKRLAAGALEALLARARVRRWVFLSYSSEGIIPAETIEAILARHGEVEVLEHDYRVFGNGAGRSRDRRVTERLYALRLAPDRGEA